MTRRETRVAPHFFDQLDAQLPSARGPQGEPSATDFIAFELPTIIDEFAERFDELPEVVPGVPAARMLITSGVLVDALAVFGLLVDYDVIDLIGITIDP